MQARTRYTRSGNVHIAYQVVGDGPFDLVYVPGWVSHVELAWEEPMLAAFLERLASFSRLIVFDKRGTGLSDRVPDDQLPSHEERMDDIRAVMDAVGCERAAFLGVSEGGGLAVLFAATYPDRVSQLVLYGPLVLAGYLLWRRVPLAAAASTCSSRRSSRTCARRPANGSTRWACSW